MIKQLTMCYSGQAWDGDLQVSIGPIPNYQTLQQLLIDGVIFQNGVGMLRDANGPFLLQNGLLQDVFLYDSSQEEQVLGCYTHLPYYRYVTCEVQSETFNFPPDKTYF